MIIGISDCTLLPCYFNVEVTEFYQPCINWATQICTTANEEPFHPYFCNGQVNCNLELKHKVSLQDTQLLDSDVQFIIDVLHEVSQDNLQRRYYLSIILEVMKCLCSDSQIVSQFTSHGGIISELEALMNNISEAEDNNNNLIAMLIWKFICSDATEIEDTSENADPSFSGMYVMQS